MISLSNNIISRLQLDSRTFRAKVTIGNTTYEDIREFSYQSGVESNTSISIGSTFSSMLTVQLADVDRDTIVEGSKLYAYIYIKMDDDPSTFDDDNSYEHFQLGVFNITSAEAVDEDCVIVAYDNFYLCQDLYETEYTEPTTVANLVTEIATACNFTFVSDSMLNVNYDMSVFKGLTYREVLGYLASFVGTNCFFNNVGALTFRWYTNTNRTIDADRYSAPITIGDQDYTIGTIRCNLASKETDEYGIEHDVTSVLESGSTGEILAFNALYMTQAQLDTIKTRMLGSNGFTLRSATVDWMLAEPNFEAGDIVTIEDGEDTYTVPIMRLSFNIDGGCYGYIDSLYESDKDVSSTFEGSIAREIDREYSELGEFKRVVATTIRAQAIETQSLVAESASVINARITNLTVNDLQAGNINTDKFTISSENGGVQISGSTQTFKDENNVVRIRIGRDENDEYTYTVYDPDGVPLMDEEGITTEGIPNETVTGEKIVISGDEGLYHELNTQGEQNEPQQTIYNAFDGSNIIAETITASKISVDDLYALRATIGGTVIDRYSLHTYGKTSATSEADGFFLSSAHDEYALLTDETGKCITTEDGRLIEVKVSEKGDSFAVGGSGGDHIIYHNGNLDIQVRSFRLSNGQTVEEAIQESSDAITESMSSYMNYDNGILTLGDSDSDIQLKLQSDRLSFYNNSAEVAYISDEQLNIYSAEVTHSLTIGRFAFVPQSNNSLSFGLKEELI